MRSPTSPTEAQVPTPATRRPPDGSVLVRVPAEGTGWARQLPMVPGAAVLTVTVNDAALVPVPVDDLIAGGYRIVGVADPARPLGRCVDVLVPGALREREPAWWGRLQAVSSRIFDLRMGPVLAVLGDELERHLAASR
jgi:hypothetical protein